MSRVAALLKAKAFSMQWGRFRPKMCGHTTENGALAAARLHEVSVGGRHGVAAGLIFRRRVDRVHFLFTRNEIWIVGRTEKAFDLKA